MWTVDSLDRDREREGEKEFLLDGTDTVKELVFEVRLEKKKERYIK